MDSFSLADVSCLLWGPGDGATCSPSPPSSLINRMLEEIWVCHLLPGLGRVGLLGQQTRPCIQDATSLPRAAGAGGASVPTGSSLPESHVLSTLLPDGGMGEGLTLWSSESWTEKNKQHNYIKCLVEGLAPSGFAGHINQSRLVPAGLLVCVCAQLRLTLCNPIDCNPPRLLCLWDSPGENTGVGCHFLLLGNLPHPGIELASSVAPALAGSFVSTEPPGKPAGFLTFLKFSLKWVYLDLSPLSMMKKARN